MGIPNYSIRHLLGAPYTGGGLTFTKSGNTLLLTTEARLIQIDLVAGRTRTLSFEATHPLLHISQSQTTGQILLVDELARCYLVSSSSARISARMSLRLSKITAARISPSGAFAAFASDSTVEIWRVPLTPIPSHAAFNKHARFNVGAAAPPCIAWSPDSHRVAVGDSSGTTHVFSVNSDRRAGVHVRPLVLYGHREAINTVLFVGQRGLLTISCDGVLLCWRLRYNDLPSDGVPRSLHGRRRRRKHVVPVEAKLMSRHYVRCGGAKRVRSASAHGGFLTVGMSNGVFALYQLPEEMADKETEEFDKGLFEISEQHQRGDKLKETNEAGDTSEEEDSAEDQDEESTPLIPFSELAQIHSLSASGGAITDIQFNSTGEWIALACADSGQVVVWEWRSETHILKQQAHTLVAKSVAFSPDGRAIATGSNDGRVKLWGVATGFCAATFTEHEAAVTAVTFAANDVILSASLDGTVRAFDIRRYRNFRILVGPPPRRQFACIAVDAAGELVAAGCVDTFEVIVWSLRTGQVLEILNGHKGPVSGISFRPRRGTLATASWDRTVRLWDMYERKGSCEVLEHSKEVLAVTFRPDGQEFASCTNSGEIVIWNPESGTVTGTIDGARDAAAGRLKTSRTVADMKGYFQTLAYSADGRFLIAGAASKHVCMYHVPEGSRPTLIEKLAVTENQKFDGLLDQLNSKKMTLGGEAMDAINDDNEEDVDYGEMRHADQMSLPGARSESLLRRKKLMKAEVNCVSVCPTGRLWAAVSTEGVLVYSEESNIDDGLGGGLFDPTNLECDVTPEAAKEAADKGQYHIALLLALRLNETECMNTVVEKIPIENVALLVDQTPILYFNRLILLFAWRLDNTPHLEFNLIWAKRLLLRNGSRAHDSVPDPSGVNTALRTLNRACTTHSKRIVPIADKNENMLRYLLALGEQSAAVSAAK